MAVCELPRQGRLWTWTEQTFAPRAPFVEPPTGFEPFCLGYVDLGEVIVEARLDATAAELTTGMDMRLVGSTWLGPDGQELAGYAFAPVGEDA